MPNHVANIISFNDVDNNRISEILEEIKNDEEEIGSIDFKKIIPMPYEVFKGNLGQKEMEQYGSNNWYDCYAKLCITVIMQSLWKCVVSHKT